MYLAILIVIAIATAFADFYLLTNFKASVLMAIGTIIILFVNYRFTISSIGETKQEFRKNIFPSWAWFSIECDTTFKALCWAVGFIGCITVFWYRPHQYSINWFGLIITLLIVFVSTFISGILGTMRGLKKHPA